MRITVLGASGMLGHVVARFLEEAGHPVRSIRERFAPASAGRFLDALEATRPEAVVNCIGLRSGTEAELQETHVRLVQESIQRLGPGVRFLQAGTDGVFRPDRPDRRSCEEGDAEDPYGRSKRECERVVREAGGCVMRCSILGPEIGPPRSLLGWFLAQCGPVRGFVNHGWNGITTLQWARVGLGLLEAARPPAVCQPGFLPPLSKAEVLRLIGEAWGRPVVIVPEQAPTPVLRTLVPDITCPPLAEQLRELRAWHGARFPEGPTGSD
jgi:dTDP-4-dehydrorhamnose reductase